MAVDNLLRPKVDTHVHAHTNVERRLQQSHCIGMIVGLGRGLLFIQIHDYKFGRGAQHPRLDGKTSQL